MAAQVDDSSAELSAETVGHAFVGQFYQILHNSPELVQRFFLDTSTMTRPGPDGTLMTVSAMKGINDLILSLDCQDYKAEILTADAQASHMDGVIVLVTGCLTGKDNVRRKFTESFFLAPQDKGYYVLNDAFRFVEEEDCTQVVDSVEEADLDKSDQATSPTKVVENVVETDDALQNHAASEEAVVVNHKEVDASKDEEKLPVKETTIAQAPVEPSHNAQEAPEASSNGHANGAKKSYASLLRNMKDGSSTLVRAAPSVAKPVAPKLAQQPKASPAVQQPQAADTVPATASNTSVPNGSNGVGNAVEEADDKGHSIYIGDLPWDATIELVEQEFKKFGRIKHNGIQVRSNKGYCFGFVEYEDATAKLKALEMGAIRIAGKEAFIQEKKTSTRVVNGVSMYPSGRGGFRNDGFRGPRGGGYSNGRGYPRNDFVKRNNGEAPFRGNYNRNGDGAFQNGGGRGGSRQPNPK